MDNQQGQSPQWPPGSGQPPNWYPPNQGQVSPQQPHGQPPQPQRPEQWQRAVPPNTQYQPQQPNTPYPPQWQPRPPYPQQSYQPPPTYYPQQQYYQQMLPPMWQPPPKQKGPSGCQVALIVVGILFAFGFIGAIATPRSSTANTSITASDVQPTDTPVPTQGTWTVTHTYKGTGEKKTEIFTVGNDWKIDYACTGYNDGTGLGGNFSVEVYGSDNSYIDLAVNEICPAGKNTTGETEEHQGGDIYLNISATGGGWVVQVQELR